MKAVRILVVEDDQDIAVLISLHLRDAGYLVDTVHDGLAALQQASFGRYELIVLDLMLPRLGGLELCQSLRAKGSDYSLILMLTARSSEIGRVLGLEIGADDYLTKPFSLRELQARVKALLRRKARLESSGQAPPGVIRVGALSLDADACEVSLSGAPSTSSPRSSICSGSSPSTRAGSIAVCSFSTSSGATATTASTTPSTRTSTACAAK